MKKTLISISCVLLTILVSCSVNEPPAMVDITGNWRVYIGGEHSMVTKDISINLDGNSFTYGGVLFDNFIVKGTTVDAEKRYGSDSTLTLHITLTYEPEYFYGYELLDRYWSKDSTYIFGERIDTSLSE
ncbi:MAG: hypothetical protein LBO69_03220 [Ignavibacteria bacterium]|jgi:hypothetical protein|nr:hypothetical protein [Ignavibacteria bacterium]